MEFRNYIKLIIIVLIIFQNFFLLSIDMEKVKIFDCFMKETSGAENGFAKDIIEGLKEAENITKECLPLRYHNDIQESLKRKALVIFLDCTKPTNNCGQTMLLHGKDGLCITLYIESIYMEGACGCVEATILHELLHGGLV